ncbi:MAG: dephospho-CoA kinase, partial [Firmicutes bacterium]|nr:dephospho-CoA kinase [Bacillota bacterium]
RTEMVYGLTGGTGSGKTTVAEYLREFGCEVVDADIIAREVTAKGSPVLAVLAEVFRADILDENGELIRKKLGSIVFGDKEKLARLNEIMRGALDARFWKALDEAGAKRLYSKVFFDAPALYETNRENFVDRVWVVAADRETRIARIMKRDGLTREQVLERMDSQLPEEEKIRRADVVIYNDGTLDDLRNKVAEALSR